MRRLPYLLCYAFSCVYLPILTAAQRRPGTAEFVPNYDESKVPPYTLPALLTMPGAGRRR